MGIQIEKHFFGDNAFVAVDGGGSNFFPIGVARRGIIQKIIIIDIAGSGAGFSVDFYSKADVAAKFDGETDANYAARKAVAKITPTLTTAGNTIENFTSYAYSNKDAGPTTANAKIYMDLRPLGVDNKHFALGITVEEPTNL